MNILNNLNKMPSLKSLVYAGCKAAVLGACVAMGSMAFAQVNLAQAPLLTLKTAPGLVMLNMGRDLSLSKAAYNDLTDLDDDDVLDLHFKPGFRYEGYFAVDRCYSYSTTGGSANIFVPAAIGTLMQPVANDRSKDYYKCSTLPTASTTWSGNFLNWVTMSRMDVLRKVLYGGRRINDPATGATTLERNYTPQDSTLWGKDYLSVANDGYDIREYAPLALPTSSTRRHMFVNVSLVDPASSGTAVGFYATPNPPLMIVYQNRTGRLWDLVAANQLILGNNPSSASAPLITQYTVRVNTCVLLSGKYEDGCTGYPRGATATTYKPTGLLQKYGENQSLAFGLLSGTYDNNYGGGVLRQNIDTFAQEVNANGTFKTSVTGIVHHLNQFRAWGFGESTEYFWDCGYLFTSQRQNGGCAMWGNPLGEMMYEGLRYFSGAGTASAAFTAGVGTDRGAGGVLKSPEAAARLNLKTPAWINPYTASASRTNTAAYPVCARPIQMVIGDPKTSFDSDQLPGRDAAFAVQTGYGSALATTLGSLNVSTEADIIWVSEFGAGATKKFFIGESNGVKDGNPSVKTANSFKNIRGHGPDDTTNQGSFYGASVARYGKFTGVTNPGTPGTTLRVDQVSIALDAPIPQIKIPVGTKMVSIVPLSKSVGGLGISKAKGDWQATGAITAFFIDTMYKAGENNSVNGGRPYYKYRISYSDGDQGGDNETDAVVTYEIKVTSNNGLSIGLSYDGGVNGIEMHQGYVISGTTADGVYLDVGGQNSSASGPTATSLGYFLDTAPGAAPNSGSNSTRLPLTTTASPRTFTTGTGTSGEFVPHDMLWYAAKYGGASLDASGAFLAYKYNPGGDPENYFLANNPSRLATQMGQAFQKAASLAAATSSALAGNGVKVGGGSYVFQAIYDTVNWGGDLLSFAVDADGNVSNTPAWQAKTALPSPASRNVVLGRGGSTSVAISTSSFAGLTAAEKTDFIDDNTFKYLLGIRTSEQLNGGTLRNRSSAVGDIVNSDPIYIATADFGYSDADYQTFKSSNAPQLVGFGGNDGYFRLLSATTGIEKLAFIPLAVRSKLSKLASPAYEHEYYVDGPSAFGHVKWGTGATAWKSVVVSSAGAGAKSVFAINATSSTPAATDVLWELTNADATDGASLGNVINKPLVGQLENDTGAVIFGNGLTSANGRAALFVRNAETGAAIRTCVPGTTITNPINNGMGAIAFVSTSNNGKISLVYGADYEGNIWRINPNDANCSTNAVKVFSTAASQPITGEITLINAPASKSGYMILFGTGSYLAATDPAITTTQALYGVWDDLGATTSTQANLSNYGFITPSPQAGTRQTQALDTPPLVNGGQAWYDAGTKKGWYINLPDSGERVIAKPAILKNATMGDRVFFLSMIPGTDPCKPGGGGWITSLNPYTGAYIKGFGTIAANSTFVEGLAPRGLFIVERIATANNNVTALLLVSVNAPAGVPSTPAPGFGSIGGITTGGGNGSTYTTTANIGEQPPELPGGGGGSLGVRRQVWRQIQ